MGGFPMKRRDAGALFVGLPVRAGSAIPPIRIGLTLGDMNGVGPELALMAADAIRMGRLGGIELVLIGCSSLLALQAKTWGCACPVPWIPVCGQVAPTPVTLWDPFPSRSLKWTPGEISAAASRAACGWIDAAVDACLDGRLDAMVTAPISKEGLKKAGVPCSGHTERIAARTGTVRFGMLLVGGPLRVVLATRHVPLRDVPETLTLDVVREAIELAGEALTWLGVPDGRVGVCGLNPHAGDGGALGDEEDRVISPAIRAARELGLQVSGPLSGDAAFYRAAQGEFDVLVAMYHDQGLAPLKLVGFETGVNLTLGLPFVRTSPDHGTAFDLAGRGLASPGSLFSAVRMAAELARRPSPWRRLS